MHTPSAPSPALAVVSLGAILAGLGVAAGALGNHALRPLLSDHMLTVYQTAVQYHLYHALALLIVAALATQLPARAVRLVAGLFTAGIICFSGSLYLLAITETRPLGMLTPVGGSLFIAGWITLAWQAFRARNHTNHS
ncbi:MAG: DUF423 domain-containing protein [Lautropia sp.]|nr:DUF423 domain-containing protein [Lautropia sp.]